MGLEHSNKFLRFFRQFLARKTSQETNLQVYIVRLWIKSDPGVRYSGPKKQCSKCKKKERYTVSYQLKKSSSLRYNLIINIYDFL